jgi:beta-lactamase class A
MENEAGRFDLDQKYVLKNEDKIGGAGSLFGRPEGYETTYRNLLKLMGKQSDNTAFNIVRKTLGDEKINLAIKSIGMVKTNLSENETSPKDIGTFFEGLMANSFISRKDGDEILGNLTDTLYENWLVAGIPEGTRVAHKYGREVHVVNDGGIVFAKDPVVVVIMSKGVVEREADEVIPKLSKIVYEGEVD